MGKVAVKQRILNVPQSNGEANQIIARIAEWQRLIDDLNNDLNRQIERLRVPAINQAASLAAHIEDGVERLYAYCEANRDSLTGGGKTKTIAFPSGAVSWRTTPPKVSLKDVEEVIKMLKVLGLERFIRTKKEEVDKEAMLADQATAKTVPGVKIAQHEEFVIKPNSSVVEVATATDKLSKRL